MGAWAPYPPWSGIPIRAWQSINILAMEGPVHVVSIGGREPGDYEMPVVAEWTHIDSADFPRRSGIRALFARIMTSRQFPLPDVLATSAVNMQLRDMIGRIKPDVIILSNWKTDYPAALREHDNVVLDMHNIESLQGIEASHIRSALIRSLVLWRWRVRERRLVRRANRTWVCGPNDVEELKKLGRHLPVPTVWPNAVDLSRYADIRTAKAALPPGLTRNGATLIYVGGLYSYPPSAMAAKELIEEIFPIISVQMPHARLVFVGGSPSAEMTGAAERDSRITVTGKVPDLREYLALADLCVVPLRAGGGTRLKILECFAAKIPVVSTAKGAEGINAVDGRDICIAESPEALAEGALKLITDSQTRTRQVDAAYELVRGSYSWSALAEQLHTALPARSARPKTSEQHHHPWTN